MSSELKMHFNVEIQKYTDKEVEEFEMDNNRTLRVNIPETNLVLNYNVEDEQEMLENVRIQLANMIIDLGQQFKAKL